MTIRWGILGCGDIARKRVAQAIVDDPQSELTAVCRRDKDKLRAFAKDFDVQHTTTSAADLINDPNLDVIYVATPVSLHTEQSCAAAENGKHVLVEKPMARSVDECRAIINACQKHNVKLSVAYYRRFYPMVERIKQILISGEIGKPMCISACTATPFAINPGEDGFWRVEDDQGGGALMDIGSHRLNLFQYLGGETEQVKAICSTVADSYHGEDVATVMLRFANGCHGALQCYFRTPVELDSLSIIGTEGSISTESLNGSELTIQSGGSKRVESHPAPDNLHAPLIADFRTAILENRAPRVTGEEGLWANAVMAKAYADADD